MSIGITLDPDRLAPHQRVSLEFDLFLRQLGMVVKTELSAGCYDLALSLDCYQLVKDALEARVFTIVQHMLAKESRHWSDRERDARDSPSEARNYLRRICNAKGVKAMAEVINEARGFLGE